MSLLSLFCELILVNNPLLCRGCPKHKMETNEETRDLHTIIQTVWLPSVMTMIYISGMCIKLRILFVQGHVNQASSPLRWQDIRQIIEADRRDHTAALHTHTRASVSRGGRVIALRVMRGAVWWKICMCFHSLCIVLTSKMAYGEGKAPMTPTETFLKYLKVMRHGPVTPCYDSAKMTARFSRGRREDPALDW